MHMAKRTQVFVYKILPLGWYVYSALIGFSLDDPDSLTRNGIVRFTMGMDWKMYESLAPDKGKFAIYYK